MANMFTYLDPVTSVAVLALAFALGAVFASFITCVAGRVLVGESPWSGRSHCDACGHRLGVLDLVPVVSWLACGGKCRYCGESIPLRCVVAEALLGVVFALLVLKFGIGVTSAAYCALAVILLGLSLVDLDSLTIPNGFVLAGLVVWVLLIVGTALAGSGTGLGEPLVNEPFSLFSFLGASVASLAVDGLVAAFSVGIFLLVLSVAMDAITGRASLGGGDVKLLFVVGLFLGLELSLLNLMISCVFGLAFAVLAKSSERAFPFGPAISAATVVTLLCGGEVMGWYLGLLF